MPTVDDLSNSNYLTQNDVDPPLKATIDYWAREEVGPRKELNFVLYFKEQGIKPFVLKKENGERISTVAGTKEFDEWSGVEITLYRDPTIKFGPEVKGGIRVAIPGQFSQPTTQPGTPNPNYVGDNPPPPTDDDIPY